MAKNTFVGSITDKRTVPYNDTKQGIIDTDGKNVIGSDEMDYNNLVGTFDVGEVITGATSGATATIVDDDGTTLNLSDIDGVFQSGESFEGETSGATADVDGAPVYTIFTKQVKVGDWIVDLSQDEVQRVEEIIDDTHMYLRDAFTSDLSGSDLEVSPCSPRPREISVLIPNGLADGEIDGVAWTAGVGFSAAKMNKDKMGVNDYINPIVVDATGTTMKVQINY